MAAYDAALEQARKEAAKLRKERDEISRRLLRVEQTIATLYRLTAGDNPKAFVNAGITDAIREALQTAPIPLAVATLRTGMEKLGYDFSSYENPSASIAGTLERLVKVGEVEKVRISKNGVTVAAYKWAKDVAPDNRAAKAISEDIKARRVIAGDSLYKAPPLLEEGLVKRKTKKKGTK